MVASLGAGMSPTSHHLASATWPTVRDQHYDVAVLPWGATEAHNTHLPYATDTIQVEAICDRAAERAMQAGARVLVLPAIPFGVQTGQREIPFCLNLTPSTQFAVLKDLVDTLAHQGVRSMVLVNGHGGNDFKQMIRELQGTVPVLIAQVNWWQCVDPKPYFDAPGDHAGELETSVMLHLETDLVAPLDLAGRGTPRPWAVKGFSEGWAWTPRHWPSVTDDTGVGDPRAATAAKGAAYVEAVVERLSGFLVELAATPNDRLYQHPDA
jgi:creatinine amidohydrolase